MTRIPSPHADRARKIREAAGINRDRVAQRLGVSLRTLARWENGEQVAPADLPQRVADACGQASLTGLEEFSTLELVQELERRLRQGSS